MTMAAKVFLIAGFLVVALLTGTGLGETNRLRVVYTNWFPYTYQEKGQATGFEIEILRSVLKMMNLEATFSNLPWQRCLTSMQNGTADVLVSLLKTKEREAYIHFSDPYISISKTVLIALAGRNVDFSGDYEGLRSYSIGVLMGFSYGDAFDSATYLKKDRSVNTPMLIRKLLMGRNALAVENKIVASAYASKMGVLDKIRFLEPPIHMQKLFVGFSRANELKSLSERFSTNLAEFKASASYGAILHRYGIDPAEMVEAMGVEERIDRDGDPAR